MIEQLAKEIRTQGVYSTKSAYILTFSKGHEHKPRLSETTGSFSSTLIGVPYTISFRWSTSDNDKMLMATCAAYVEVTETGR